jgi:hypothetical protein
MNRHWEFDSYMWALTSEQAVLKWTWEDGTEWGPTARSASTVQVWNTFQLNLFNNEV